MSAGRRRTDRRAKPPPHGMTDGGEKEGKRGCAHLVPVEAKDVEVVVEGALALGEGVGLAGHLEAVEGEVGPPVHAAPKGVVAAYMQQR